MQFKFERKKCTAKPINRSHITRSFECDRNFSNLNFSNEGKPKQQVKILFLSHK